MPRRWCRLSPRARVRILGLGFGMAVCAASLWRWVWEPGPLLDAFLAQRAERAALRVWQRRACPADWARCRSQPGLCLGKVVVWPVTHPAREVSRYGTDGTQPILWRNDDQVPLTTDRFPFTAVALVERVGPLGIELTFLGTPSAAYGGTTWARHFGLIPDAGPNDRGQARRTRAAVRP